MANWFEKHNSYEQEPIILNDDEAMIDSDDEDMFDPDEDIEQTFRLVDLNGLYDSDGEGKESVQEERKEKETEEADNNAAASPLWTELAPYTVEADGVCNAILNTFRRGTQDQKDNLCEKLAQIKAADSPSSQELGALLGKNLLLSKKIKDELEVYKKRNGSRTFGGHGRTLYNIVEFFIKSKKPKSDYTEKKLRDDINKFLYILESDYGVLVQANAIKNINGITVQKAWNEFCECHTIATANMYSSHLNPFFSWAYKMKFVDDDLSGIVKYQKPIDPDSIPEEERIEKMYTVEQVRSLFELIEKKKNPMWLRDRAMVALFVYSGIRKEEMISLTIKQTLVHGRGKIYCKRKGGKWKDIYVSENFYQYLDPYLASRGTYTEDDPLFENSVDPHSHMKLNEPYTAIREYQDELGLMTGVHVLRHVFVSAIEKIGGVSVARDCANHKNLHVTNRYDHSTEEDRRKAVDALDFFSDDITQTQYTAAPQDNSYLAKLNDDDRALFERLAQVILTRDEDDQNMCRSKLKALNEIFEL